MCKSKKQLKQKHEELEKETIIDYESEEYKIMCEEYEKIEKEYNFYSED